MRILRKFEKITFLRESSHEAAPALLHARKKKRDRELNLSALISTSQTALGVSRCNSPPQTLRELSKNNLRKQATQHISCTVQRSNELKK